MARDTQLLVDIGATWLRAELRDAAGGVLETVRGRSGDVQAIAGRLHGLLRQSPARPSLAALGVPGRVLDPGGVAELTYLGAEGRIDFREVFGDGVERVHVLNDLQAGVAGTLTLASADLRRVQGADDVAPQDLDAFALVMPGTGLGVGLGGPRLAGQASEAGNAPAAIDPRDADEQAAASALRRGDALPSYQDLTSAGALEGIARALAARESEQARAFLAALAEAPVERRPGRLLGDAPPAVPVERALRVQARVLARAAQMVALTVLPDALVLGGGYLRAAWPRMADAFCDAFPRASAHAAFLASMPIRLADVDDLNLRGLRAVAHRLGEG